MEMFFKELWPSGAPVQLVWPVQDALFYYLAFLAVRISSIPSPFYQQVLARVAPHLPPEEVVSLL